MYIGDIVMPNFRCTIRCPSLPTDAKGISPDEEKKMSLSKYFAQVRKNENFNKRAEQIASLIQSNLSDVDITFGSDPVTKMKDGTVIISGSSTKEEVQKFIRDNGFELVPDRSEIKHKGRPVGDNSYEDIDVVFEKGADNQTVSERLVTNEYKQAVG